MFDEDSKLKKERDFLALSMQQPGTSKVAHFCEVCIFWDFKKRIPELRPWTDREEDETLQ